MRVKTRPCFPCRTHGHAAIRPGDHIMATKGAQHGPRGRVCPWQAEMNNLPALRRHRDGEAQLCPKGLGPCTAGNNHLAGGERFTGHDDTDDCAMLERKPLHTPLLYDESTLFCGLSQGMVEQTPIDTRGATVVQGAIDGNEQREQLPGLAARDFIEIIGAGEPVALLAVQHHTSEVFERHKLVLRDGDNELAAPGIAGIATLLLLEACDKCWVVVNGSDSELEPRISTTAVHLWGDDPGTGPG